MHLYRRIDGGREEGRRGGGGRGNGGWMDRWMEGWTNGRTDRQMYRWMELHRRLLHLYAYVSLYIFIMYNYT